LVQGGAGELEADDSEAETSEFFSFQSPHSMIIGIRVCQNQAEGITYHYLRGNLCSFDAATMLIPQIGTHPNLCKLGIFGHNQNTQIAEIKTEYYPETILCNHEA
jgi:hypothetical protein